MYKNDDRKSKQRRGMENKKCFFLAGKRITMTTRPSLNIEFKLEILKVFPARGYADTKAKEISSSVFPNQLPTTKHA
jgi:hypothetical protein